MSRASRPRPTLGAAVTAAAVTAAVSLAAVSLAAGTLSAGRGGPPRGADLVADAGPAAARPATVARRPTARRTPSFALKGVGAWWFPGARPALQRSGAAWYYTWSVSRGGISAPRGVSIETLIYGPQSATRANLRQARRDGHVLLGFNEPDVASQSDMTVAQALRLWPRLMSTGMRLGSPAVAVHGDMPGGWLDRFMRGAAARHYRVSFITLHWYGGDFRTAIAVAELKAYVQAVWARYHRPIWLTEFALIRFGTRVTFPSPRREAAFVTAATAMLRRLWYVWRYAWFALPATSGDGTAGLFRRGALPTTAGRAFEKVPRHS